MIAESSSLQTASTAISSQLRSLLSKEFGKQQECPNFSRFVDTFTSIEKLVARHMFEPTCFFSKRDIRRLLHSHSSAAFPSRAGERGPDKAGVDGSRLWPPLLQKLTNSSVRAFIPIGMEGFACLKARSSFHLAIAQLTLV